MSDSDLLNRNAETHGFWTKWLKTKLVFVSGSSLCLIPLDLIKSFRSLATRSAFCGLTFVEISRNNFPSTFQRSMDRFTSNPSGCFNFQISAFTGPIGFRFSQFMMPEAYSSKSVLGPLKTTSLLIACHSSHHQFRHFAVLP